MCLAIPGKVIEINGDNVIIEYGEEKREANCSLVKCNIGEYVIIQAGFVMVKVPEEEALKSLEEWKKVN